MNTAIVTASDMNTATTVVEAKPLARMDVKVTSAVIGDINHVLATIQALPFEERQQLIKVAQAQLEARLAETRQIDAVRKRIISNARCDEIRKDALVCLENHTHLDNITLDSIKSITNDLTAEDRVIANGVISATARNIRYNLGMVVEDNRPWYKRWFSM